MLDAAAGLSHSLNGRVVTALAAILTRHEELLREQGQQTMGNDASTRPDDKKIQEQIWLARGKGLQGGLWATRWPGTTYEQGVHEALRWVLGQSQDRPVTP